MSRLAYIGPIAAIGMVAYALPIFILIHGLLADGMLISLVNRDFVNYWVAGNLVLEGEHLDLFNQQVYFARLQELFGRDFPIHNWGYPPHFLLLIWPLGFLSYKTGLVLFLLAGLALFLFAVWKFKRQYAPLADGKLLLIAIVAYGLMMIDTTQNGFLTAALLLLGLTFKDSRPILAGLAFGLLTIKPQLGLLLPLYLLFERNWAAIFWSVVFTAVLVAVSAAVFGTASWVAYLTDTLEYQRFVMTDWYGIFLAMMPTVFGAARSLGLPPETAYALQWPVSIVTLMAVIWLLRQDRDPLRRIFIFVCGTFLVSPYALNYDMGALAVIAALILGSTEERGHWQLWSIGAIAALPAAVMNLGRAGLPIAPLLLAAGLIAIWAMNESSSQSTWTAGHRSA